MSSAALGNWIVLFRNVFFGIAAGSSFSFAQDELPRAASESAARLSQRVASARESFERGLSQVSVNRLEPLLREKELDGAQRVEVRSLLVRAFLKLDRPEKVRDLCGRLPEATGAGEATLELSAEGCLAVARAHMQLGRYHEASGWYLRARAGHADSTECTLGNGAALVSAGRLGDAEAELRKGLQLAGSTEAQEFFRLALGSVLIDSGRMADARVFLREAGPRLEVQKQAAALLEARLLLGEGRASEGEAAFEALIHSKEVIAPDVFLGATLGCLDAMEAQGKPEAAGKMLAQFFSQGHTAISVGRERLFEKWVRILSGQPDVSEEALRKVAVSGSPMDRPLAVYSLGEFYANLGKAARADEERERFCKEHSGHVLTSPVCLKRAEFALAKGDLNLARESIAQGLVFCVDPRVATLLRFKDAIIDYQNGEFAAALERFESLSQGDSEVAPEAAFNGGLAALRMGNYRRAGQLSQALRKSTNSSSFAVELELETVLQRCRDGHSQAEESLRSFLKAHAGHPREADAKLAFVELTHQQLMNLPAESAASLGQPLRARASAYFKQVMAAPMSSSTAAQAAYLEVFLADAEHPRDDGRVIELAEAFVRAFSESPLIPQMRMKLGEVYFRRKDFANAETQFATLVAQQPDPALAETAGYLAGQCAANLLNPGSVDRALVYWDEVARRAGPLRWKARYQQASVKCRLGQESEGVVLFDLILKATSGVDADLRFGTMCGRADALLVIAKREGLPVDQAIEQYQLLAAEADAVPHWRNQALYKIAKAYETSRPKESLEGFVRLLEATGSMDAGEYFWVLKAGFDAARILERQSAWRDAVNVYERIAKMPAPRAQEAGARARQIRLERFLWD
jgi:tetratricopeptide (TPR) repeat protein